MSALEEYRRVEAPNTALEGAVAMEKADAAIDELGAENERLRVEILGLLRSFVGVVVNITATANEVNETIKAKLAHYEVQP